MGSAYVRLEVAQRVATVTIDRPDKRNALSPEVLQEIEAHFGSLAHREDVHVAVLTGGEKYFSAGFDLAFVRTLRIESNGAFTELFHRAYRSILFCPLPVIAAVGGPAIAGGFDLTMMCDFRYASERAKFGQREIALSLTPLLDPLWRIVGMGRAKELALTGRICDAREAERMGYVNRVFPEGDLLPSVREIARAMADFDRRCLAETKRLSHAVLNHDLDGAMKTQEWLFRSFIGSEDSRGRADALLTSLKK